MIAYAHLGQFDEILKICTMYQPFSSSPSYVVQDVLEQAKVKCSIDKVVELLSTFKQAGFQPTVKDYNTLMSGLVEKKEYKDTLFLMYEMKLSSIQPNEMSYYSSMQACFELGNFPGVLSLLEEMRQADIVPTFDGTYLLGLKACTNLGKCDLAVKYLEEMNKIDLGSVASRTYSYNLAISACALANDWQMAQRLFEEMEPRKIRRTLGTYSALIRAYVAVGKWDVVISTSKELRQLNLLKGSDIARYVLSAYINTGKYSEAIEHVPVAFGKNMEWRCTKTKCDVSDLTLSEACPLLWYFLRHHVKRDHFDKFATLTVVVSRDYTRKTSAVPSALSRNLIRFLQKNGGPSVSFVHRYIFRINQKDWESWMNSDDSKRFG
jgi:pentatricopeptide repeat protein